MIKMKMIAQRFMQQITDVYQTDPVTGNVLPGNLVRSVDGINSYIGQAMIAYFDSIMKPAAGRQDFLNKAPEFFGRTPQIVLPLAQTTYDLSGLENNKDIYDILDSYTPTAGVILEAWNPVHLNDALTGNDPFYKGTALNPGMILMSPILYLFPLTLTLNTAFPFYLNYIKNPISPTTGNYFDVNSTTEDCPFSFSHLQDIADLAVKIFDADDLKEDPA
jgi:hypothetical protein